MSLEVAHINVEPKRDRHGRYVIDGKSYTRATTVAKALEDSHNLTLWKQRQTIKGAAMRPDLIVSAQAHDPNEDKKLFGQLVDQAMEASASGAAANIGTAIHRFTEDLDHGRIGISDVPPDYREHVGRYQNLLQRDGIQIHAEWIEQVVYNEPYGIAGTVDRIVTTADGKRRISDLKTGKDLKFSALAIAIQMAIYAHHTNTYDYATEKVGPRVDVELDYALVFHVPSNGEPAKTYKVDLGFGFDAMLLALEIREWRNDAKKKLTPYEVNSAGTGGESAIYDWFVSRVEALKGNKDAVALLRSLWPDSVPQPFPKEATEGQADAMDAVLNKVERQFQLPFQDPRPGKSPAGEDKETGKK